MSEPGTDQRRGLGRWGENQAADHLTAAGYSLVARNWRCRGGEIDLIFRDGETVVFVEVKTRRGRAYGAPEEALTPHKAQKLLDLGQQYVACLLYTSCSRWPRPPSACSMRWTPPSTRPTSTASATYCAN